MLVIVIVIVRWPGRPPARWVNAVVRWEFSGFGFFRWAGGFFSLRPSPSEELEGKGQPFLRIDLRERKTGFDLVSPMRIERERKKPVDVRYTHDTSNTEVFIGRKRRPETEEKKMQNQ